MRERRGQMNERKERGKIWIKGWVASDETGLEPAKHTASLGIIYIYIYIYCSKYPHDLLSHQIRL